MCFVVPAAKCACKIYCCISKKAGTKQITYDSITLEYKITGAYSDKGNYYDISVDGDIQGRLVRGTPEASGTVYIDVYQNGVLQTRSVNIRATCSVVYDAEKGFTYHCIPGEISVS